MDKEWKRKMKRVERKKRKMSAYLAIAELNDVDRLAKKMKSKIVSAASGGSSHKMFKEEDSMTMDESAHVSPHKNEKKQLSSRQYQDLSREDPNHCSNDIDELRKAIRERRKKQMQRPKFKLKESGELASLCISEENRIPLFMVDIQHLIMWSLLGHHAPFAPSRWYQLLKFNKLSHTVVLAVDGMSLDDLQSAKGLLRLNFPSDEDASMTVDSTKDQILPWRLEFIGPSSYGSNLVQEIATVPLSNTQYDRVISTYGSIEKALKGKAVYKVFRAIFPVREEKSGIDSDVMMGSLQEEKSEDSNTKDKFPRTQLLLSADQMVEMGYPLPLVSSSSDAIKQPMVASNDIDEGKFAGSIGKLIQSPEFAKNFSDDQIAGNQSRHNEDSVTQEENENMEDEADKELYVFSRPWYKEVGPNSPLFAVDCEMCLTGKHRSELTRISVVNEDLEVVYESLVKPSRKITNYLTRFSGITESMLKNVKTQLSDVQRDIQNLLPPDAILVGQSLNFDLHAMKMMHPYVIDTSVAFNLSGERSRRTKLATLSRLFLSENIQCGGSKGHDSVEDASAAMKLVLLKLSKNIYFGDAVLRDLPERQEGTKAKISNRQKRLAVNLGAGENMKAYARSVFTLVNRGKHTVAVVGEKDAIKEYQMYTGQDMSTIDDADCSCVEGKPPKLLGFEHSSEVISCACEIMLEHQLCIVHLARDSFGGKLKTLEKWCRKIVDHAAPNALCIVILGGSEKTNGACLIHLKEPDDGLT